MSNRLDPDHVQHFFVLSLVPNCLQRLLAGKQLLELPWESLKKILLRCSVIMKQVKILPDFSMFENDVFSMFTCMHLLDYLFNFSCLEPQSTAIIILRWSVNLTYFPRLPYQSHGTVLSTCSFAKT